MKKGNYLVCPKCGAISWVSGISNKNEKLCHHCKTECNVYLDQYVAVRDHEKIIRDHEGDKMKDDCKSDEDIIYIIVKKDGSSWCAHDDEFIDLQASEAEFASTPEDAAWLYIHNWKNVINKGVTK